MNERSALKRIKLVDRFRNFAWCKPVDSLKETELPNLARERAEAIRKVLAGRLDPARLIDDKPAKDAKPVANVVFNLR